MAPLFLLLLTWYQLLSVTYSSLPDKSSQYHLNIIEPSNEPLNAVLPLEFDDYESTQDTNGEPELPYLRDGRLQADMEFHDPLVTLNVDSARNMLVLRFAKNILQFYKPQRAHVSDEQEIQRSALKNSLMSFEKRQAELHIDSAKTPYAYNLEPPMRSERSRYESSGMRDSRGDNFMRFGRVPSQDFMRFGRNSGSDYMRLGRGKGDTDTATRVGRDTKQDFMRFGRAHYTNNGFMRFGRPDNFMRFGRKLSDRDDKSEHVLRLGQTDENFMRFGKSNVVVDREDQTNYAQKQKHDLHETTKLLHKTQKNNNENPMDRAIQLLFSKEQQRRMEPHKNTNSEETTDSSLKPDFNISGYEFKTEN